MLALVVTGAATLSGPAASTYTIPGTESQRAVALLKERFPGMSASGAEARVVFAAPTASR